MRRFITALCAGLLLGAPLAARAQDVPSYAAAYDEGQIRGRVTNFDGGYNVQVRDDKGYIDAVRLHQGTIINPTGLTLAPGMVVSILGYNAGSYFAANEIDTPYTYYGGFPYYQGRPWNYWGPSVGLTFFFGNTGWWHGNAFGGPFRYNGGVRVYDNVHVNDVYRGGSFRGRDYAAPPERGGWMPRNGGDRPQGDRGSYGGGDRGSYGGDRGNGGDRGSYGGDRGNGGDRGDRGDRDGHDRR
jgi:hypothetical protein